MEDHQFQDRLTKLETENRRMKRWLLGVVVLLAAMPLLAFAKSGAPADAEFRIVYASKFALKDPRTGKMRAELSHQTQPGGWAGITLWDDDGRPRGEFKLWEDGRTILAMTDAKGRELSRLSVTPEGDAKLVLDGKEIQPK